MKTLFFIAFAVALASCEIIVVDSDYDQVNLADGVYQVEEYSQTYNQNFQYSVWINQLGGSSVLYIDNFYDQEITVKAEVIGRKLYIRKQYVDGYEIEGSGTIWGSKIQLDYSIYDVYSHKPTDYCEATLYW
jgi:hypothetical protein